MHYGFLINWYRRLSRPFLMIDLQRLIEHRARLITVKPHIMYKMYQDRIFKHQNFNYISILQQI